MNCETPVCALRNINILKFSPKIKFDKLCHYNKIKSALYIQSYLPNLAL